MKVRVKVEGLREIQSALKELPKATGKNIMKRVLLERAKPIRALAEQLAPRDRGVLAGSIQILAQGNQAGKKAFADAMRGGASRKQAGQAARTANRGASSQANVFISTTKKLPHAHMQEFGTINQAPNPYMRPAWDQHEASLLDNLAEDMWAEIKKAVARRAKKLAKAGK